MTESRPIALALDFDDTIALTLAQAFGSRNVKTAYEYAIQDLFGDEVVALYRSQGGLNNRAPTEIIIDLGVASPVEVIDASEKLVKQKLAYLLPEIGKPLEGGGTWPLLCPGFRDFWVALQPFSRDHRIKTAVVSNGHDSFITRVFDLYELPHPDVLVSDDDVRHRSDVAPERRHKPDPLILEIAATQLGIPGFDVYIGDNILSDGVMAQRANIAFGYYNAELDGPPEYVQGGFQFGSWRDLILELPSIDPKRKSKNHATSTN